MDLEFIEYIAIGFFAQAIDGALGMAYGVISTTFLLSLGLPPAQISASVHTSEIVTTAASGISHAMFKNVHWELVKRIVIPGVIGSVLGAYLLTIIPTEIIKPGIALYLFIMGCFIFYKSLKKDVFQNFGQYLKSKFRKQPIIPPETHSFLAPIGFVGGFLDSIGGGGWGAIVTSSLLAGNTHPRYTIGSVNFTEFLIALSSSMTFYMTIGISYWRIIFGLIIGGALAAPIGGYLAKKIPAIFLMRMVSILVIFSSLRLIWIILRA